MPRVRVMLRMLPSVLVGVALLIGLGRSAVRQASAQTTSPASTTSKISTATMPKPDFPKYSDVTKGYEKVVSTMDGKSSLYTILVRKKDNQMLAELPSGYSSQKQFIAMTIASGEDFAGLQAGEMYVYWKRYGKRVALIEPNIEIRSTGDQESKDSVKRLFTDRVILDVPILTLGSRGTPVIDMDALLVGQASKFFGSYAAAGANPRLITIKTAKAFPKNVELGFEAPMSGGRLKTLHYSISVIPSSTGYKTRVADQRVGFFTTAYDDLGKFKDEEKRIRYINRWHLEKADPKLKLSPAKNPIVFYIEHTTPKRYRYWVKEGLLYWNKAFEKVGIRDAIEVLQQDSDRSNPKHMEKDPEDVRYNFIRWLSNDIGTAIGPSRVNPLTGQILDADIILTDGWIRHYEKQFSEVLPKLAMEGFSPQTLAWLNTRPNWDPRIRFAPPSERTRLLAERHRHIAQSHGGHPAANVDPALIGDDEYDGLIGCTSQVNGMCLAAEAKSLELAMLRMTLEMLSADEDEEEEKDKKKKDEEEENGEKKDDEKKDAEKEDDEKEDDEKKDAEKKDDEKKDAEKKDDKKKEKEQMLDGLPESFIGPLLSELVAHEVGHTLGLRHNFKGSSVYTLEDIGADKMKGKPYAGSIMDYLPINMHMKDGKLLGDHTLVDIGPYDMWAIEYGYSFSSDLKPILGRVAEPELIYGTDEDTWGPDPRSRRYDFSANPLDYAKSQVELAKYHRERLLEKFVKDGDSWAKARRGYEMTLSLQVRSLSMMANWIGGTYLNRDKKGDKNARVPMEPVCVKTQRAALAFVIENAFRDEAFGLTPKLLNHLAMDQWLDGGMFMIGDADWPVHDRIMGIQSSALTMLMNPDTLRLVYDNELRTPEDQEMITLPELLDEISSAVWTELDGKPKKQATARKPWISSLRRNLQREHMERLIDLTLPDAGFTAAYKPVSNLAMVRLRALKDSISKALEHKGMLDPYSAAHLGEAQLRIGKALDAQYIYNSGGMQMSGSSYILFGEPTPGK